MHTKPFISVNRVAALLGVHHTTAKRMLKSHRLVTVLIGRRQLYRTSDVLPRLTNALGL